MSIRVIGNKSADQLAAETNAAIAAAVEAVGKNFAEAKGYTINELAAWWKVDREKANREVDRLVAAGKWECTGRKHCSVGKQKRLGNCYLPILPAEK